MNLNELLCKTCYRPKIRELIVIDMPDDQLIIQINNCIDELYHTSENHLRLKKRFRKLNNELKKRYNNII